MKLRYFQPSAKGFRKNKLCTTATLKSISIIRDKSDTKPKPTTVVLAYTPTKQQMKKSNV